MLEFDFRTNIAHVSVIFQDKVNILFGDSGEGKSLLMQLLSGHLREHGALYDTVDWNVPECAIWDRLNGTTLKKESSILLYDNGDLTLTPKIYEKLCKLPCTSIISLKRLSSVCGNDYGLYEVVYSSGELHVEKYL